MSTRHKAIKATLDRGYASEWNDDHIADFTDEIEHVCNLFTPAITTEWDTGETAGGTVPTITLVGAAGSGHVFVVFNTGATTGQLSSMRHELNGAAGNITSLDDYPMMTFTMNISAIHTAGKVIEAGLVPSATAPFTANQDGAYFRVNNNLLYAVTGDGAAETATSLGAYDAYAQYRIEVVSVGGVDKVNFYVDDMDNAAAVHTTNLPNADLTMKVSVISANNVDSTIHIDGVALNILRKNA